MNKDDILKELEKERLELESEFLQLGKEIKICRDSETRKKLQESKKEIQFDLDDVKLQIENLKQENITTNTKENEDANGTEKP